MNTKLLVVSLVLTMSGNAFAALKYPLLANFHKDPKAKKSKVIELSSLNKALKKVGSKVRFNDYVVMSNANQAHDALSKVNELVAQAAKDLDNDSLDFIQYGDLETYSSKDLDYPLCYTGDAKEAVKLIQSLTDNAFSDQLMIDAYKLGTKVYDAEGKPYSDNNDQNLDSSEWPLKWRKWSGKPASSLAIVSTTGDDGDDYGLAVVPECK